MKLNTNKCKLHKFLILLNIHFKFIGEVLLVGVENKKTLNVKNANGEITCLFWFQEKIEPKAKDILNLKDEEHNDYMRYIVSVFTFE